MALALARKYRPKRFADVAVQEHVSATLQGAIARGRVAQGYLLCGPRGVGKTTLARVLAMALNCERLPRGGETSAVEPCGECVSCQRIWSGAASLDVVEIDAASNRGVDDARELRERAMYAPSGDDRYKVYIVDEAHMLTREAWNALLKILEEPPPRVVFVFATTEPQKIAQTAAPVMSRLQRFDFKRIGPSDIKTRLSRVFEEERIQWEPEGLSMIARAADGSMRDALSLSDQVLSMGDGRITAERVRDALGLIKEDELIALLDILADRRAADVFPFVERLADSGIDFGLFLTGLGDIIRAQLAVVLGGVPSDVSEHARAALEERRSRWVAGDLLRMLSALGELELRFRRSGQQQLLIETILVRFALLDRSVEIEELLQEIREDGGGKGESGKRVAAAKREAGGGRREAESAASGTGVPNEIPVPRAVPAVPADRVAPISSVKPTAEDPALRAASLVSAPAVRAESPATREVPAPRVPRPASREAPPDLNRVSERWDDVIDKLRAEGKQTLATALSHATPATITATGDLTIELDEPNEIYERAFDAQRGDVAGLLRAMFPGLGRVDLRRVESRAPVAPPKRLTDEMVRSERLAALKKRDPTLGAAIDELDLDVVD